MRVTRPVGKSQQAEIDNSANGPCFSLSVRKSACRASSTLHNRDYRRTLAVNRPCWEGGTPLGGGSNPTGDLCASVGASNHYSGVNGMSQAVDRIPSGTLG